MKIEIEHLNTPDPLDNLLPMHVQISPTGHITHAGPTIQKICGERSLKGVRVLEVFRLLRPRLVQSVDDLRASIGQKLKLRLREAPETGFKGLLVSSGPTAPLILNLSLDIALVDAIRNHDLHAADFAATDMSVELLYLIEAKSAAMNESRNLNQHLQAAKVAAEEQAFTDTLTGLKNRRGLSHLLDRMSRQKRAYGLMQLDLDYFKNVNDRYGHAAGDHVLQRAAEIMVQQTRSDAALVRAGGDEFVLIFPDLTDPPKLMGLANRLIKALEEPIRFGSVDCHISGSIGITVVPSGETAGPSVFLEQVDQALYASKRAGRGCATMFSPHHAEILSKSAG